MLGSDQARSKGHKRLMNKVKEVRAEAKPTTRLKGNRSEATGGGIGFLHNKKEPNVLAYLETQEQSRSVRSQRGRSNT